MYGFLYYEAIRGKMQPSASEKINRCRQSPLAGTERLFRMSFIAQARITI
jgi:hypothetical protein